MNESNSNVLMPAEKNTYLYIYIYIYDAKDHRKIHILNFRVAVPGAGAKVLGACSTGGLRPVHLRRVNGCTLHRLVTGIQHTLVEFKPMLVGKNFPKIYVHIYIYIHTYI